MDQSSTHETIYDSSSFLEMKNLLLSKKEWAALDIGIAHEGLINREDILYLLLIDNRCYVIDNDLSIYFFDLNYILINHLEEPFVMFSSVDITSLNKSNVPDHISLPFSRLYIDYKDGQKILDYRNSLVNHENDFLEHCDTIEKELTTNVESYELLINFWDLYLKDFFKSIDNVYILEDDFLSSKFCREKIFDYYIVTDTRDMVEQLYQKLLDLFFHKGILEKDNVKDSGYVILTRCLRDISTDHFPEKFSDLYKGYFPLVEKMTLKKCINSYYKINRLY